MLAATLGALAGCAISVQQPPPYPQLLPGEPASRLGLHVELSRWSTGFYVKISVDGFAAARWVSEYWGLASTGDGVPPGSYELRIPAGSHVIELQGDMPPGSPYVFEPVVIEATTAEEGAYAIRIQGGAGSLMRPGFRIAYEGWADAETATWPRESLIANPLF